jgi:hypothetical protein
LITELNARFDAVSSQRIVEFMRQLPSTNTSSTESDENSLQHVLQLYVDDLPSPATFNAELDVWKQKWNSDSQKSTELNTAEKALEIADINYFYPNIRALLQVMATLPVTSCECERSISMLRLVKSPLRSSMGQDRLNGLAMLYYRLVDITPEVVEEFALSHPQRMLLVNPFQ